MSWEYGDFKKKCDTYPSGAYFCSTYMYFSYSNVNSLKNEI